MRTVATLLIALSLSASLMAPAIADSGSVREWNFRVLLNDDEIGYHRYRLQDDGERRTLESEAKFDVRFLFFTAYRYRHSLSEQWDGTCLESIETDTDTNGKDVRVSGRKDEAGFVIETGASVSELPACVMTFAYWDPMILDQEQLLNPQTGEYLDVTVEPLAEETLLVRGEQMQAKCYRLTAKGMQINVWYSDDNEWLALESPAKGGRIIRYELT